MLREYSCLVSHVFRCFPVWSIALVFFAELEVGVFPTPNIPSGMYVPYYGRASCAFTWARTSPVELTNFV